MATPPVVYITSTYPPRRCGLATFSSDLATSLAATRGEALDGRGTVGIIALSERRRRRRYAPEVRRIIHASRREEYGAAAAFVNASPAEVISLQHEYGIFGGRTGSYVLSFLADVKKPVVTTLHTVLAKPKPQQREILRAVCAASAAVVVQAKKAASFLRRYYGVAGDKVNVIPHGTPDVPLAEPAKYKKALGVAGREVLLTFGLIGPRKGIQFALRAMTHVLPRFPNSLYIVLGATHPFIKKRYGEKYRGALLNLVSRLGLNDHVKFVNRFVSRDELIRYLQAADIYLTPYLNEDQISSGTLAYAVACGKAIISTPYWYAQELLAYDRGVLVPFRDVSGLAFWLGELLADTTTRRSLSRRAYRFGRRMTWARAAAAYDKLFRHVARTRRPQAGTGGL